MWGIVEVSRNAWLRMTDDPCEESQWERLLAEVRQVLAEAYPDMAIIVRAKHSPVHLVTGEWGTTVYPVYALVGAVVAGRSWL